MKLFLCHTTTTSDDEEEEEVSEEEQFDDSVEDEDVGDTADSNEEEDFQGDTENENDTENKIISSTSSEAKVANKISEEFKNSLKVNGKPSKIDESLHDSDASLSSDDDTPSKSLNAKLDINGVKQEDLVKKTKFIVPKTPSKTKSTSTIISEPARLKNISTEMMVLAAIRTLNERGGSSAIAIKKYIMNNYPQLDGSRTLLLVKKFIKKAVASGKLVQAKGNGLGGSFKMSAELNRMEEQKERQNRKKLKEKVKNHTAAGKADKKPKASVKTTKTNSDKGEKKTTNPKKAMKTKTAKAAVKKGDSAVPAVKETKKPAPSKNVPKVADSKQPKKAAANDAKPSIIANGNPTEKPTEKPKMAKLTKNPKDNSSSTTNATAAKQKRGSPTNTASTLAIPEVSASPAKVLAKGKTPPALPIKKTAAKGKENAAEPAEIGAGDADTTKLTKKAAGRKAKAK